MRKLAELAIIFRIISAFCWIGAFFFILAGIYRFVLGFIYLYESITKEEWRNPGLYILEGLDSFLVAVLFLIFSSGIYKIFIYHNREDVKFPPWLNVNSFSELKLLLWETTIVTLIVFSISVVVHNENKGWEQLIVPSIILMLSIAYFLTVKSKNH